MAANPFPDFSLETSGAGLVCGIDEVGRAPLAGPVTASCVLIPDKLYDHPVWKVVTDSKSIARPKRARLSEDIKPLVYYGIGWVSEREIEQINIHYASLLAMKYAFEDMIARFSIMPDLALIDGKHCPSLPCNSQAIIKGDSKSKSIAAASIIAKVARDNYMEELDQKHPSYSWHRNAGYPSKEHIEALVTHGPTIHHRRTFARVREFFEDKSDNKQKLVSVAAQ